MRLKKISVILPVYNEELFLPHTLANIEEYVDEIIVIDGSDKGASTDKTAEIAQSHPKVKYYSGIFLSDFGGWDTAKQRNDVLKYVTGDVMMLLSADMLLYNMEILKNAVEKDYDLFGVSSIEFWLDTKHIRVHNPKYDLFATPAENYKIIAVNMNCDPSFDINGNIITAQYVEYDRCLYIPQSILFHFGWIRPFKQQVQKHIRHVTMGLWGESGLQLLRLPYEDLEKWAIRHALTYSESRCLNYYGIIPDCDEELLNMRFDKGCNDVLEEYENKYGIKVLDYIHKKENKNAEIHNPG